VTDGDAVTAVLLERITALEQALAEAQGTAARNAARSAFVELPAASAQAPQAATGRRRWLARLGPPAGYERLGRRFEHLLRLAEEQAADVLAAAHQDADQIRATARADAAKIRSAALSPDDAQRPANPDAP